MKICSYLIKQEHISFFTLFAFADFSEVPRGEFTDKLPGVTTSYPLLFRLSIFTVITVSTHRDTLRIREAKIFSAVLRWSEAECIRRQLPVTPTNQRTVLGRAFNAIRFPLMSVEEFAMGPAQSGLLDDREIVQLFLYFTVNPKPNVGFLDTPRCCMTGKELTVNRFPQTESRWGYSGTTDRIRFTVDQRIFVVGFGLYGSYFGPTEYEVHLQVCFLIMFLM